MPQVPVVAYEEPIGVSSGSFDQSPFCSEFNSIAKYCKVLLSAKATLGFVYTFPLRSRARAYTAYEPFINKIETHTRLCHETFRALALAQLLQRYRKRETYLEVNLGHVDEFRSQLLDMLTLRPVEYLPLFEQVCRSAWVIPSFKHERLNSRVFKVESSMRAANVV